MKRDGLLTPPTPDPSVNTGVPLEVMSYVVVFGVGFMAGVVALGVWAPTLLRTGATDARGDRRPPSQPPRRDRADIESDLRRAIDHLRGRDLQTTYRWWTDTTGAATVDAHVVSPEGSIDVRLAGDDLRSEPVIRYHLLDGWSMILEQRGRPRVGAGEVTG